MVNQVWIFRRFASPPAGKRPAAKFFAYASFRPEDSITGLVFGLSECFAERVGRLMARRWPVVYPIL
jgi:hypothetical protein